MHMNFSKTLKAQRERLVRQYYRARNLWPIWYYLLNREARSVWKRYGKTHTIGGIRRRVVGDLQKDGIARAHLDDLFPGEDRFSPLLEFFTEKLNTPENQEAIREYRELLARRVGEGQKAGKLFKDFRVNLWYMSKKEKPLDLTNPFIRLILSDAILEIVAGYMEIAPKFAYGGLQTTLIVPPGTPEYLSQRWHRDPEDKKFLRMFVYLNDVFDVGTGPFMYVKGSHYGGRWRDIFPQIPPAGRYPPNGAVERVVSPEDILVCLAKAGTLVFADTSGLHRGGYSTEKERFTSGSTFFSSAAIAEQNYRTPSFEERASLSPLGRYAVE